MTDRRITPVWSSQKMKEGMYTLEMQAEKWVETVEFELDFDKLNIASAILSNLPPNSN